MLSSYKNSVLNTRAFYAACGYELLEINPAIDEVIIHIYKDIPGEFWPPERKHIQSCYEKIDFPFNLVQAPEIFIETTWAASDLIGYLSTWSSVQAYGKKLR
jgi:hypothetical protein